jgi:tetratricopeptide (TPR) repeat protein
MDKDYSKKALHKRAAQFYRCFPCPPRGKRTSIDDIMPMLDAIKHLIAADQAEEAVALLLDNGIDEDLHWWGHYLILTDLYRRLLSRTISPKKKIALHIKLGKIYRNLGELEEAKRTYESALPFIGEAAGPESEIALLNALGDVSYYLSKNQDDLNRAFEYLRRAEDLLVPNPNPLLQSENAGDMGNVRRVKGESEEAQRLYERAIFFSQEAGSRIYEGIWYGDLGNVHCDLFSKSSEPMHRKRAISYFLQAIAIAKETKDRRHESHWNGVLGNFYRQVGEYELAEAHLREALFISVKIHYGRMIPTQVEWMAAVFGDRIQRYVQNRDFEAAFQVSKVFQQTADEIGNAQLKGEAERQIDVLKLNNIFFLFQEGCMDEAIAKGCEFLMSFTGKTDACATLGSICMQWGRQTGKKDIFQLSVDAYTKAISISPVDSRHVFYLERANAYALMGKIEEAIADYSEVIRREPQNTSAALSWAEVQIWAGRYAEARLSLEALHPRLKTAEEKVICAWLMCHALNLEGQDFSAYKKVLEETTKENIDLNYNVRDIEPYLQRLDQTKFSETQIQNAWMIQTLIRTFSVQGSDQIVNKSDQDK